MAFLSGTSKNGQDVCICRFCFEHIETTHMRLRAGCSLQVQPEQAYLEENLYYFNEEFLLTIRES